MNRILSTVFALFLAVTLSAQSDSEKMAARAYADGAYSDAVELYKAAIALSSDENAKSLLQKKLSNARMCLNTCSQAEKRYAEGKYDEALELYQKLSRYNPKDSKAKKYIPLIEELKIKAQKEEEIKRILESEYIPALKGSIADKNTFIAKHPDTPQAEVLSFIIKYDDKPDKTYRDDHLLEIAKEYLRYNIRNKAVLYLKRSAALGNPEALYLYGMEFFEKNTDKWVTFMALSAEGGYHPAADALTGNKNYSKTSAKRMYKHLIAFRSDIESAVYIKTNSRHYYLDLDVLLADMDQSSAYVVDMNNIEGKTSCELYDMAEILPVNSHGQKELYKKAAYQGNVDAMYKYAILYPSDNLQVVKSMLFISYYFGIESSKNALSKYLFYAMSAKEDFKVYMKYLLCDRDIDQLNREKVRIFDALMFAVHPLEQWCNELYDQNDALLLYCATAFYDKEFWKQHKETVWDSQILSEAKDALSKKTDDSDYKKFAKKLAAAKSAPGTYTNPLAMLLKVIKPETIHRHAPSVTEENIFGPIN